MSHHFTHLCSVDNDFLQICLFILHVFSIIRIEVIRLLLLNVVGGVTGRLIVFPYKHHVTVCLSPHSSLKRANGFKEFWINSCLTVYNERTRLSFAVNRTSFTMTNSMSLSTHHSWHSLHTTSPQYVVKVRIIHILLSVIDKKWLLPFSKIFKCYRVCFFQPANDFCSVFSVPRNQLLSVAAACKVLIEFSLLRLENPDEACAVSQVRETNCMGERCEDFSQFNGHSTFIIHG